MAHVRLDNVLMPEARKLTLKGPAQVLAESAAGDPLYAVLDRPAARGRSLVLTVDLDKSDLPLQTAFPIMMTNLLGWFARQQGRAARGAARRGGRRGRAAGRERPDGRPGAPRPRRPRASRSPCPTASRRSTVGPLDRCGVWSVVRPIRRRRTARRPPDARETSSLELACNLADRRESDLRPAEGLPERHDEPGGRARRSGRSGIICWPRRWLLTVLGVVPLSAKVDRLMGTMPLAVPDPARADPPLVAAGPGRPAGPGLLLLPEPGRFRPLAAGPVARCSGRSIVVLLRPGAGGPDPGPADPRAVRRLRGRPQPERRRRGEQGGRRLRGEGRRRTPARTGSPCCRSPPSRAASATAPRPSRRSRNAVAGPSEGRRTDRPPRPSRPTPGARSQGDRPGRGARGGGGGDPAVLRPADRRSSPTATQTAGDAAQGRRGAARQGRGLDRPAAGPRPTPRSRSRPSTSPRRSSRASRSTSRS